MLSYFVMTIDSLRNFLGRRPFEPFRVITSSGERYDVRHPENAILYKSGLIVAYGATNGSIPESYADLALLHITAVERLRAPRPRSSGRRKRR